MTVRLPCLLAGALIAAPVQAQTPPVGPAPAPATTAPSAPSAPSDGYALPGLTPVRIEILAHMNSQMSKIGEHFPIRLAAPIDLGDGRQIPAGATGSGDVVHAAKSRFGGKPGELILAARYIDHAGVRIPLRSLSFTQMRGRDNVGAATGVAIAAGVVGYFITGGEVDIPAGTLAVAKTSAPVTIPAASLVAAPALSPTSSASTTERGNP